MGNYVYRGGGNVGLPPFIATGARMYCFALPINAQAVNERILDPCYNQVSGGALNYKLALDFAFVTFVQIPSLRSGTPPQDEWGYSAEQEMAIWLMAVDPARLSAAWLQPYIIVDNTVAMSSGREIYGFPKAMGEFDMPPWPSEMQNAPHAQVDGERFECRTLVMPTYTRETKGVVRPLVTATALGDRPGDPLTWGSMEEAVKSVLFMLEKAAVQETEHLVRDALSFLRHPLDTTRKAITEVETGLDYVEHLMGGDVPLMLLKQFPDAGSDGMACYQSIVHVDSELVQFNGGGLLPHEYKVTLGNFASHPVAADLGVSTDGQKALLSYYLDFDFNFKPGSIIWPE